MKPYDHGSVGSLGNGLLPPKTMTSGCHNEQTISQSNILYHNRVLRFAVGRLRRQYIVVQLVKQFEFFKQQFELVQ
jgi:hypothetical protein